jgi:hypothetical protein
VGQYSGARAFYPSFGPIIRNVRFEKVLIDDGSALDILFLNALTKLDIKLEDLEPYDTPL